MNITHWLLLIVTALALTGLTWWGCAWWYGRKLADLQQRLDKTRQTAGEHVSAARRQIAQLNKELAERPPLSKGQRQARDDAADAAARKAALEKSLDDGSATTQRLPTNGFADTQPM